MILEILSIIFSNVTTIARLPNNVRKRYLKYRQNKYLIPSYKFVEQLCMTTSNQNSPGGFPIAINSKETWKLVNSMAWLLFNVEVGNYVAKSVYNNLKNNSRYTKQDYINDWHDPLLQSYENDFDLIKIWEYRELENYQIPILTKKKKLYYWFKRTIKNCKNTNWRWCLTTTLLGIIVYKLFL